MNVKIVLEIRENWWSLHRTGIIRSCLRLEQVVIQRSLTNAFNSPQKKIDLWLFTRLPPLIFPLSEFRTIFIKSFGYFLLSFRTRLQRIALQEVYWTFLILMSVSYLFIMNRLQSHLDLFYKTTWPIFNRRTHRKRVIQ